MVKGRPVHGAARGLIREAAGQDTTEFPAGLGSAVSACAAPRKERVTAPRRRSQQERRSEAEARLLAAARTLLSRKGWVGMTLAEVGEAAGYSRGHATHHFGNKGALLRALTAEMYRSFGDEMRAAPPSPVGLQAVLGYVRVFLGRGDPQWTNTRALLLLLAEALLENSDTGEVVAEYNRETFAWLEDNLRVGIAQGNVRPNVDPALGADFVVGAMRGVALQRFLQGQEANIRGIKEQVLRMVEQAFAVPISRDPNAEARDEQRHARS